MLLQRENYQYPFVASLNVELLMRVHWIIFTTWGSWIYLYKALKNKNKKKKACSNHVFGCNKVWSNLKFMSNVLQDKHNRMHESTTRQTQHNKQLFLFSSIFSSTRCITQTPNTRLFSSMKLWKEKNNPKIWVPHPPPHILHRRRI